MRYWLYFVAKLVGVVLAVRVLLVLLVSLYPKGPAPLPKFGPRQALFLHDMLFTFLTFGIFLVSAGLLSLTIWDQTRRCRTCLRRLIMPLAHGSWGNVTLFGRPKTEWICRFGHGTLTIETLQLTGRQAPDWQRHDDDIWKELESSYQARK